MCRVVNPPLRSYVLPGRLRQAVRWLRRVRCSLAGDVWIVRPELGSRLWETDKDAFYGGRLPAGTVTWAVWRCSRCGAQVVNAERWDGNRWRNVVWADMSEELRRLERAGERGQ